MMISIEAMLKTTATVGNRRLVGGFKSGAVVIHGGLATGNVAASAAGGLYYSSGSGASSTTARQRLDDLATNYTVQINDYFPLGLVLRAGDVVQVYDFAAIDAAADDLTVVLHYVEYDA